MRFEIVGKNITITDSMREKIEKKLSGLQKYLLIDENTTARVVARVYPTSQKIEVTIPVKGNIIRSEQVSSDMYVSIDLVEEIIERQLKKYKSKIVEIIKKIKG